MTPFLRASRDDSRSLSVEFFKDIGGFIMTPLYFLISAVLLGFHRVFGRLFGAARASSWALSIIGLTIVIRAAADPAVRQADQVQPQHAAAAAARSRSCRRSTATTGSVSPRRRWTLYRETRTNPFSSCLPLIIQMPIFLALFRLIDQAAKNAEARAAC